MGAGSTLPVPELLIECYEGVVRLSWVVEGVVPDACRIYRRIFPAPGFTVLLTLGWDDHEYYDDERSCPGSTLTEWLVIGLDAEFKPVTSPSKTRAMDTDGS